MKISIELDVPFTQWAKLEPLDARQVIDRLTAGLDPEFFDTYSDLRAVLIPTPYLAGPHSEKAGWPAFMAGVKDILENQNIKLVPCLNVLTPDGTRFNLRWATLITDPALLEGIKGRAEEFEGKVYLYKITEDWSFWQLPHNP